MTQQHPITPPPELMQRLYGLPQMRAIEEAFQAGADAELEACRMEIIDGAGLFYIDETSDRVCLAEDLWSARRPKPPSLKEQALDALSTIAHYTQNQRQNLDTIRRALEQLPK